MVCGYSSLSQRTSSALPEDDSEASSSAVCGSCFQLSKLPNDFLRQVLASLLGGSVATVALNPVNVVKIELQKSLSTCSVSSAATHIFKNKGLAGFGNGAGIGLLQTVPNTVIYMTSFEQIKYQLLRTDLFRHNQALQSGVPALAAGLARLISGTLVTPAELIRTIKSGGSSHSVMHIAKDITAKHGLWGLYRGWSSNMLRDVPYSMLYWYVFEATRPIYSKQLEVLTSQSHRRVDARHPLDTNTQYESDVATVSDTSDVGMFQYSYSSSVNFLAGATCGSIASIFTHPFDVLKTRQQLAVAYSTMSLKQDVTAYKHQSVSSIRLGLANIFSEGGFRSLFKGLSMRLLTVTPAGAIMVTVYEYVKYW